MGRINETQDLSAAMWGTINADALHFPRISTVDKLMAVEMQTQRTIHESKHIFVPLLKARERLHAFH